MVTPRLAFVARFAPVVLIALIAVLSPASAQPGDPQCRSTPSLRRDGRWLVDHHGRVVIVHGVNMIWKTPPYYPPPTPEGFTAADASWLNDHGFNAARIGTLWVGVSPNAPGMIDDAYLDEWDGIVQELAAEELWILFDFHQDMFHEQFQGEGIPAWAVHNPLTGPLPPPMAGFPGNYFTPHVSEPFDNLWANAAGVWDGYRDAWQAVATRWKTQPYHMGYDLLNEPWAGMEWLQCLTPPLGCPTTYTDELQPTFEHILAGIRSVDPDNIVWFEPQLLAGGQPTPIYYTAVDGEEQLGYSWHNYCPHGALFQSLGADLLSTLPIDTAQTCEQFETQVFENSADAAQAMNAVAVMTEFGASDDLPDVAQVTRLADEFLSGWIYWHYKNWADPTTQSQESGAQSLFEDDADFATLKQQKARLLIRTYPRASAGIPQDISFDTESGDFHYVYTPRDACGAPTEIFVSPLHYPDGYGAIVAGATVTSGANAEIVTVEADGGASQVVVDIRATERIPSCSPVASTGCRSPIEGRKASLRIRDREPDSRDRLLWKWVKGAATSKASDFGDPVATTAYSLCMYDGSSSLVSRGIVPAAGRCGPAGKPCWKESARGFTYRNRDLAPDGILRLALKDGADGKAKIVLKGRGPGLAKPALPIQTLPLTVQLTNGATCWEASYGGPATNEPERFKARAD